MTWQPTITLASLFEVLTIARGTLPPVVPGAGGSPRGRPADGFLLARLGAAEHAADRMVEQV